MNCKNLGECAMESKLLDQYPWAANHENAIRTVANFLGIDFEDALKQFDTRILHKVAKDQLQLPKAA